MAPAGADDGMIEDTKESGDLLDIAQVTYGHLQVAYQQSFLVHTMTTFEPWENEELAANRPSATLIGFRFNIDDDDWQERTLRVGVTEDGSLVAVVIASRMRKHHYVRGYAAVSRPDERTVRVVIPPRLLKKDLDGYSWNAFTQYHDTEACPGIEDVSWPCSDYAPDSPATHRVIDV